MPPVEGGSGTQQSDQKTLDATEPAATKAPLIIQILYPTDPLPISHIHFAKFSQLGGEILMDLGILDDQAAIARIAGLDSDEARKTPVKGYVTGRFAMSPDTLRLIRTSLDQLWKLMGESGALKKLGLETLDGQ